MTHLNRIGRKSETPVHDLMRQCGNGLERIQIEDKLALIGVLARWLAIENEDYDLYASWKHCNLPTTRHFKGYLDILSRGFSPQHALGLIVVLSVQVEATVFGKNDQTAENFRGVTKR